MIGLLGDKSEVRTSQTRVWRRARQISAVLGFTFQCRWQRINRKMDRRKGGKWGRALCWGETDGAGVTAEPSQVTLSRDPNKINTHGQPDGDLRKEPCWLRRGWWESQGGCLVEPGPPQCRQSSFRQQGLLGDWEPAQGTRVSVTRAGDGSQQGDCRTRFS